MTYIGQTLENPVTGEKLTFVETASSTNGARVVVDLELVAGGKLPGVHGKVHDFANAGDETAYVRVTISRALKMEEMFETTVALASERKVLKSGMPKPLELALFVREFDDEARAPFPSPAVVRAGRGLTPRAAARSTLLLGA